MSRDERDPLDEIDAVKRSKERLRELQSIRKQFHAYIRRWPATAGNPPLLNSLEYLNLEISAIETFIVTLGGSIGE